MLVIRILWIDYVECYLNALQIRAIPDLDGVVPQSGDNLAVIVLQTIDTLRVLGPAVDAAQHVAASPPVVLYAVNVLKRIECVG